MSRGKRTSSCAVLLLLCTVLVLSGATNETKKNSSTCALQCDVPHGKTETKCTLMADPLKLNCSREVYSSILRNVSSLDLSNNKLTRVPTWMFPFCKSLTELSLSRNNIKEIKPNTFKYLKNLKILNLSFNDIREWKVNPNNELQSLNDLDVTDNEHWLPSEQLLQLKNLTTVRGLTLTKYCKNCFLMKPHANVDEADNSSSEWTCRRYERMGSPSAWKWHDEIQYGKALYFIKLGFWPTCLCDEACFIHQYKLPYFTAEFDVSLIAHSSLYATGSVALLVNITVVLVIAFHKSLRGDLAVWLILNVAVCDVLIGLITVLVPRYNYEGIYIDFLYDELEGNHYNFNRKLKKHMNILGPILTCALLSEVAGSIILTLEKFLKIVFAMRPDIRIEKRGVVLFLFLSWSFSVTYALLPVFNVGMTYYNAPIPTDDGKAPVGIAFGTAIVGIIIQLTSCVLYVPIFIVAKRSAANVGIKRDAAIAKKIALLVFTNFIFFIVPGVLFIFQGELWRFEDDQTLTGYQWIGLVTSGTLTMCCVGINSLLNPFLYALRHPKIKQQLHTISTRCRTVLSECFVALGQHLPCHSNAVEQLGNDMEMQEVN